MIDIPQTSEQELRQDEAHLNKLRREEICVATATHCGFADAIRRTRLLGEIMAVETKILHDRKQGALHRA